LAFTTVSIAALIHGDVTLAVKFVAAALAEETKRFDNDSRLDNKLYRQNN